MPIEPETDIEAFKVATNKALDKARESAEELKDLVEATHCTESQGDVLP